MKYVLGLLIAAGIFLVSPSSPARADSSGTDTVTLEDGTILKGQVTEETDDYVVIQFNGSKRKIARNLVSGVVFNAAPQSSAAPEASGPSAAPQAPVYTGAPVNTGSTVPDEQNDYTSGIAKAYKVPESEVVMVQRRGIPAEEVPVVFFLASRARVLPSAVVSLRLGGMSWMDVSLRFGLSPSIFYYPVNDRVLVAPYDRIYLQFRSRPRRLWGSIVLADLDIVNCVNLRFVSARWHRAPIEVMRLRGGGVRFDHIWFGYSHPGRARAVRGEVRERDRRGSRRHEDWR